MFELTAPRAAIISNRQPLANCSENLAVYHFFTALQGHSLAEQGIFLYRLEEASKNFHEPRSVNADTYRPMMPTKSELRQIAKQRLAQNVPLRRQKSAEIWRRLETLDVFCRVFAENNLMLYLDFQHEVETTRFIKPGQNIVVPCCVDDWIQPTLTSLDELEKGPFGILEPREKIRRNPKRWVNPDYIAVVLVPGLAFDTHGNRLGRGRGFYDRFLSELPPETVSIGLAFECQIFPEIPVDAEDRPVTMVVTEKRILDNNKSRERSATG